MPNGLWQLEPHHINSLDAAPHMSNRRIETVQALLHAVAAAEGSPGAGKSTRYTFYRGQSNGSEPLLPGSLRRSFLERAKEYSDPTLGLERQMLADFRVMGEHYRADSDDVSRYFDAQHHGLPTRLLDWSLSPLVALYFAVEDAGTHSEPDSPPSPDGAVFVLDTGLLMTKQPVDQRDPTLKDAIDRIYRSNADNSTTCRALAVIADERPGRLRAQHASFTLHPPGSVSIQEAAGIRKETDGGGLLKLEVPRNCKEPILEMLRRLGIHRASLFPDLGGVVVELKRRHYLDK